MGFPYPFPIKFAERTGWAYAAVDELKRHLQLDGVTLTASLQEWAEQCLLGASRNIDNDCGRVFYSSELEERLVHGNGYPTMVMDLVSVSAVAVDGVAWTAGAAEDYILGPLTPKLHWPYTSIVASLDRKVWPKGQANVAITGVWGFPQVPHPIYLACLNRAKVLWNHRHEIGGESLVSMLQGDLRREFLAPEKVRMYEMLQVGMYVRGGGADG